MHYTISAPEDKPNFFEITATVQNIESPIIEIQLPAWRPGRYQIQNFAKNIREFNVENSKAKAFPCRKITKDRWRVEVGEESSVKIRYLYFANEKNAGSSFVSKAFWYINFVNLCVYVEGRQEEACEVHLKIPNNFIVACGLPASRPGVMRAKDYQQLADCPMLASASLAKYEISLETLAVGLWINGKWRPREHRLRNDFEKFIREQIAVFGEFPEPSYEFLLLMVTDPFYHGVEHGNSSVLVLGPDEATEETYSDLLGLASHEIFHAWNIKRIRPKELLPYDFTKENYFETCFIAEGVTTYYGDLLLRRAQILSEEAYLKELGVIVKRHFASAEGAVLSLTESSFDLWLDGYEKAIPKRRVSVYDKGALAALVLDLIIRRNTNQRRCLDDVMRQMWERFGKPYVGYSLADYQVVAEEVAEKLLDDYWQDFVLGARPILKPLNMALGFVGLRVVINETAELISSDNPKNLADRAHWLASRVG